MLRVVKTSGAAPLESAPFLKFADCSLLHHVADARTQRYRYEILSVLPKLFAARVLRKCDEAIMRSEDFGSYGAALYWLEEQAAELERKA